MGPFILAWFIGEGIISYRAIKNTHAPPVPGALLATSGIFGLLAILAEFDAARPTATLLAYGFDIAAFMNIAPGITGGHAQAAAAAPARKGAGKPAPPRPRGTLATPAQSPAG